MKAFKDYETEDFIDMGGAHQPKNADGHIPFVPFCRAMEKVEYICLTPCPSPKGEGGVFVASEPLLHIIGGGIQAI